MKWLYKITNLFKILDIEILSIKDHWFLQPIAGDTVFVVNDDETKPVLEIRVERLFYKPKIKIIINPYKFEGSYEKKHTENVG